MKLKKAKIIIKNIDEVKAEWKRAMKGEVKYIQKKNEIVFTSLEIVLKVLTKNRIEVMQSIAKNKPRSIYELAKMMEKDFKSVHTDVKFLCDVGLIELEETENARNVLKPIAKFSGIEFEWAA